MTDFSWGIIGYGVIAEKFAQAIEGLDGVTISAVYGRTRSGVERFAEEHAIPGAYDDLTAFLADPSIDAVYVAALNNAHYNLAKAVIEAGKPLLCEKPFMTNAAHAEEIIRLARGKKVFAAEATWTKTLPVYKRLRQIVREGGIGDLRLITAEYFYSRGERVGRLYDKESGGGTTLDIGIYELALVSMFLGTDPVAVSSTAYICDTGVDEVASIAMRYKNGAMAHLVSSFGLSAPYQATLIGTKGRIDIPEFGRAQTARVYCYKENAGPVALNKGVYRNVPEFEMEEVSHPFLVNGFEYQILEVMDCVRSGKTESGLLPLDETLGQLKILDRAAAQWGT